MTTTHSVDTVIRTEKEHIRGPGRAKGPFSGLALSGGGIRSASFALGVLQGLFAGTATHPNLLDHFDYLSTVSGGGYIGTALTWFRHKKFPAGTKTQATPSFPFGRRQSGHHGAAGGANQALNFIRQHGNYLTPAKGLDLMSLTAVVLRSTFVSLFVYLSLLTVAMFCWRQAGFFTPHGTVAIAKLLGVPPIGDVQLNDPLSLAGIIVAALALTSLAFSIATVLQWGADTGYRLLIKLQKTMGLLSKAVIALLVIGSLPYLESGIHALWMKASLAGGSTLAGVLLGLLQSRRQQGAAPAAKPKIPAEIQMVIGAALLVYGLLFTAFLLAAGLSVGEVLALTAAVLAVAILVNLNHAGLHRMYRDRLMETFQPNPANVQQNRWGPATEANRTLLEQVCPPGQGLYHLINCNVVLVDSANATHHGRGGDSFLLSPLFCGSSATGWRSTDDYMKNTFCRGITLPTAMAVSGAAANPNAGVAGQGVTRNRVVSTLMSLLNLRLGYWARNPQRGNGWLPPNYLRPGLSAGVFGAALSEANGFIELTDGGHFENLALYELVRRQVRLIVVSDAGADPDYTFEDLANAVEKVRVDFGVKIRFRADKKFNLEGLMPGSATAGLLTEKYGLARRGYAVADIDYGDNAHGVLIYLKPTLTRGLPEDIYGYKTAYPTFPDQTTADQFFDEVQFEAYRELGYQLAKQMLASTAVAGEFHRFLPNGNSPPAATPSVGS